MTRKRLHELIAGVPDIKRILRLLPITKIEAARLASGAVWWAGDSPLSESHAIALVVSEMAQNMSPDWGGAVYSPENEKWRYWCRLEYDGTDASWGHNAYADSYEEAVVAAYIKCQQGKGSSCG